ncbi:uncharacterized protein L203_101694 [Cryptococcus depauperatus CBS 7841]|uniref:Uncharacterized protein n=1 Tax=Cryptococcus depauperatus CBS 7841 TaxID=1295531 RepID=A0AAJ8JQD9_9TREE
MITNKSTPKIQRVQHLCTMTQSFPRPLPASSSSQSLHHSSLPATSSKSHRPPQSSLSVQLFQQRHAEEFPHLYKHHNPEEHETLIKTESQTLEEARRIGRTMRESMIRPASNNGPPSQTRHKGRRPLSLVMNGSTGQPHIDNMDHGLAVSPLSTAKVSVLPSKESLDYFAPYLSTQISSSSYSSKTQIITPGQSHLNLGFGSQSHAPASLPEEPSCSSADTSLQHSTYSWASSFSGETEELRLAAHYIPSQSQEDIPPSEEEILGTPEKTNRRRKRIVAIAHTARQLEGVGSRDAEDPSFYPMLIKAWNDRYGIVSQKGFQGPNKEESNSESPNAMSITAIYANPGAWFAAGPSLNSKINQQVRPNVSSDPLLGSTAQSSSHARYSFASSAHDLVEDGGMERGAQIMSEKAWLRTPLRSHEAFFGAQSQPAPFPLSHKEPISHHTDGSNFSNDLTTEEDTKHAWANHHGKKLRRVQTDITNIKKARDSWSLLHELPNFPQPRPIGLGFVGNQPIFSDGNPTIHKEQKQDFQHGEDRICIKETKKDAYRQGRGVYGDDQLDSWSQRTSELSPYGRKGEKASGAIRNVYSSRVRGSRLSTLEPLPETGLLDPLDHLRTSTHQAPAWNADRVCATREAQQASFGILSQSSGNDKTGDDRGGEIQEGRMGRGFGLLSFFGDLLVPIEIPGESPSESPSSTPKQLSIPLPGQCANDASKAANPIWENERGACLPRYAEYICNNRGGENDDGTGIEGWKSWLNENKRPKLRPLLLPEYVSRGRVA